MKIKRLNKYLNIFLLFAIPIFIITKFYYTEVYHIIWKILYNRDNKVTIANCRLNIPFWWRWSNSNRNFIIIRHIDNTSDITISSLSEDYKNENSWLPANLSFYNKNYNDVKKEELKIAKTNAYVISGRKYLNDEKFKGYLYHKNIYMPSYRLKIDYVSKMDSVKEIKKIFNSLKCDNS